jgi:hypothetical protein
MPGAEARRGRWRPKIAPDSTAVGVAADGSIKAAAAAGNIHQEIDPVPQPRPWLKR